MKKKTCIACNREIESGGFKDVRGDYYHDEDCWYVGNILDADDAEMVLKKVGRARKQPYNKIMYNLVRVRKK